MVCSCMSPSLCVYWGISFFASLVATLISSFVSSSALLTTCCCSRCIAVSSSFASFLVATLISSFVSSNTFSTTCFSSFCSTGASNLLATILASLLFLASLADSLAILASFCARSSDFCFLSLSSFLNDNAMYYLGTLHYITSSKPFISGILMSKIIRSYRPALKSTVQKKVC